VVNSSVTHGADQDRERLFNGTSLDGWTCSDDDTTFVVREGSIVSTSKEANQPVFLQTATVYENFELEFEVKLSPGAQAGVIFRGGPRFRLERNSREGSSSGWVDCNRPAGHWLEPTNPTTPHRHFLDDDWNQCRIVAIDGRIQTKVNGQTVADFQTNQVYADDIFREGPIVLEVTQENVKGGEVSWKNLQIKRWPSKTRPAASKPAIGELPPFTPTDKLKIAADDQRLWKAAVSNKYYRNRQVIIPPAEPEPDVAALIDRLAQSKSQPHAAEIASLTIAQTVIINRWIENQQDNQNIQKAIPAAWNLSKAGAVVNALVGRQPHLRELADRDVRGGIVSVIDKFRENVTAGYLLTISMRLIQIAVADEVEQDYRERLQKAGISLQLPLIVEKCDDEVGSRPPGYVGMKLPLDAQMVRISNHGNQPLHDVVVIARTEKHPTSEDSEQTVNGISLLNRMFDSNTKRVNDADLNMRTAQMMHATPEATMILVPVVEPGDTLHVPLYASTSWMDVKQCSVAVYASTGLLDTQVIFEKEPYDDNANWFKNDKPKPKPRLEFTRPKYYERMDVSLKPVAEAVFLSKAQVCVPHADSFFGLEIPVTLALDQTYQSIARSRDFHVLIVPSNSFGSHLVLVPVSWVAKAVSIDERNDKQLAQAKAYDEQRKASEKRKREQALRNRRR
jgi:hypothetical protein